MQVEVKNAAFPILEKNEYQSARDENWAYGRAQKCACNLIWCPDCFKRRWIPKEIKKLLEFDHTRTRQIILTFSRDGFKDGQDAWEYTQDHSLVTNFIRNLRRGLKVKKGKTWAWKFPPVMISKYRYFLEWHKDGFPHYHIFIEVESEGKEGMIGQDFIHYYWPAGVIIKEKPFKSLKHWQYTIGDLKKFGYFGREKKHQTTLPKWALDRGDIKIYRSGGSRSGEAQKKDAFDVYCDNAISRAREQTELTKREYGIKPVKVEQKTYRERINDCGQESKVKLVAAGRTIEGVFKIPYRKIVKQFKGIYIKGEGYVFKIGRSDIAKLMGVIEKITLYVRHKISVWHKELVGLERWKYYLQEVDYSRA